MDRCVERYETLLGTDFDGGTGADFEDVRRAGLEDPRHKDRVPELTALLEDADVPARRRFEAALALATWGEAAGYEAVVAAARAPKDAPWYGTSADKLHAVDDSFAQLLGAVGDSAAAAEEKGTSRDRDAALRALIRIADTEFFGDVPDRAIGAAEAGRLLPDIQKAVVRGCAALAAGSGPGFDLAPQLVELASAVARSDEHAAVQLCVGVLATTSHAGVLRRAVTVVRRGSGADSRDLAEYVKSLADEETRALVEEAVAES